MTLATFDPTRADFSPYGFTCLRWQATRASRPDRHNEIEISILGAGSLTYLIGGRRMRVRAGQLYVFWAAIPHQIVAQQNAENFLVATVPLTWVLQWRLPLNVTRPLLDGKVLCSADTRYAEEDVLMLSRWIAYMEESPATLQRIILLEVQARLLRFALTEPSIVSRISPRAAQRDSSGLCHAERLAWFIAQHCTQCLSAEDMGRAVDLHPNYAMMVFKQTFGITLNAFLTRQRIFHAQRLLITSDKLITEIAYDSGFNSISRFNAAFHQNCECSPIQYRRRYSVNDAEAHASPD